ncbi:MAG: hypothetical protein LAP13_23710 [Acidobacteriia bacterium]|nr:hypothetical protein [Terriglobia bacterium]
MSRRSQILPPLFSLWIVGSLAFAGSQGRDGDSNKLQQSVFVYNYAQVPANSLERAKREAARIFRQAGVEIVWRDCPLGTAEGSQNSACEQFIGPATLLLRIVPRFEYAPGITNKQTLGSSVGNLATVSFHWVKDEAASGIATPSEILGPAIAHELGHLLLGRRRHSPIGIMRPRWSRQDFQRSPLGAFIFTSEEANLICAGVRSRAQAQADKVELSSK